MFVKDGNDLLIFQRQSNSNYWCYDGLHFVGSKPSNEALEWGKNKERCFIVNGRGTGYTMIGTKYYENSDTTQDIPLELTSGTSRCAEKPRQSHRESAVGVSRYDAALENHSRAAG